MISVSVVPSQSPALIESPCPFDIETVVITRREYIELKAQVNYWKSQHASAVEREQGLADRLNEALAKNRDLNQRLFGKKSEKKAPRSDKAFIGRKSDKPRGAQPGGKWHGRTPRGNLQVREETVDIPADEACCPECQLPFIPFPGTEDTDYIEIEVAAYIRRQKRKRYRPACKCKSTPGIITAPMAPRLLSRNKLGVSVWADVLLDKYLYARATNRLLQKYQIELGLPISPGTIADGLKRIAPMFKSVYAAFHTKQMTESLFFGDETRWSVFENVDGKTGHRWWLWIVISNSVTYYYLASGRGADVPKGHFSDLDAAILQAIFMCDRFSSYKKMAKDMAVFILAFCWAHVRRDFIKAARSYPDEKEWMFAWVESIGSIYHINNKRCEYWDKTKTLEQQSPAFMAQQDQLKNTLVQMAKQRDEYLADSELSKPRQSVLKSLKNHWDGLTVFVNHPAVHMDNNISERAARKGAIGRNNYYGSGSVWSGDLMATMFTLLHTLKQWNINQHHWLTDFLNACARNGGKASDDLSPFLPWEMSDQRKTFLAHPLPPPTTS